MKHIIFYLLLFGYAISLPAQNSFRSTVPAAASSPSPSDRWDLSKYVWSHTHATHSKKDKPVLDFEAIDQWQTIGPEEDFSISPNAQYFAYSVKSSNETLDSLIVQAVTGAWQQAFPGAIPGLFSNDNQLYVFQDKQDLCFLQPGTSQIEKIPGVVAWQQPLYSRGEWIAYQVQQPVPAVVLYHLPTRKKYTFENATSYSFDESDTWLVCKLNNAAKELVLHHLHTGEERRFPSVAGYSLSENGKALLLQTIESNKLPNLQYINLNTKSSKNIWSAADSNTVVNGFSLDTSGQQAVFMLQDPAPSIWYYKDGMTKAVLKVNQQTTGMDPGFVFGGSISFTYDGNYIFFDIQTKPTLLPSAATDAVKIDVWSHKDPILQITQPWLLKQPAKTYSCIIHSQGDRVIRLQQPFESLIPPIKGDFVVLIKRGQEVMSDRFWEKDYYKDSIWLVSLKDGTRTLLKTKIGGSTWFSPDGNYLVYFDRDQQCNYFSIHLVTGKVSKISAGIPALQLGIDKGGESYYIQPPGKDRAAGIAAWLEKDQGVLVYDEFYDIWQLDLAGKKPPINITNAYARQQHIRLRLPAYQMETPVIGANDTLLLSAFNTQNKQSGFFKKILSDKKTPERLFMGDCMVTPLFIPGNSSKEYYYKPLHTLSPLRWVVKRQRADEAPNYQLTADFITYQTLTNLQPQKKYNWLTAELHSFKQMDGTTSQGILYKPENFDPAKKYPVIVVFYGTLTKGLHEYKIPTYISSPTTPMVAPAWLTSHGYLVFTPDVYYKKGQWGPSTQNTVDGAALYISSLPFVDGKHIGACGHSNSGRSGYYVLTHSKSFAAMCIGSATTNVIESALSTFIRASGGGRESSLLEGAEVTGYATGLGSLWQNKETWLDHTAVLHADKATSPALLFHNKKDGVPARMAMEMFIALRRLEKKAWWLHYEEGGHVLFKPVDLKDFTIRYTQFFDHYLKGAPPPNWMAKGIPLQLKGIDNGYELNLQGSCGKDCPVCNANSTSRLKK